MTVKSIFDYLNSLYPVDTACDFDNSGLLVGDGNTEVTKALLSLDCTLETVKIAVEKKCQLIITHHPVIFSPLKNVIAGSVVYELIKNGISVISMHTNLDIGEGGVNDCLCDILGLQNTNTYTASDGFLIRCGEIPPTSADSFAETINSKLGGRVKFVDGGKEISRVLVCSGSGGDFIEDAIKGGFDALVTADTKHHQFLVAKDNGISLFDAGHFETEDVCIEPLKEKLETNFKEITFITDHTTNIKYQ